MPTLLELLGCAEAGADLPCVIEWNPGKQACKAFARTLVTGAERYTFYVNGEQELYDLKNDPHEVENLADVPERQARVRELRAQLAQWQRQTRDTAEAMVAD